MKIGMVVAPGNTPDWDRFLASERHEDVPARPAIDDVDLWDEEVSLGLQAEPLGFEAIFCPEHHFTPYSFTTNPLQLLTYFAGRTESIDLGSMVVVAPWHHPLRLAEEAVMLQHLMGTGRDLMLGLGRGLARREYNSLGIDMSESRQRFQESVEILRLALTEPRFSYDGVHFKIPETALRPYPRDLRLLENLYCAWGSPQSAPIAAALGLKPFLIPQKPLDEYGDELDLFAQVRAENGHDPAQPMLVTWVYCAETEEKARQGAAEHMRGYARTPVLHYEINSTHFSNKSGYEHYAAGAEHAARKNLDMVDGLTKIWLDNHIWGTPEQCFEKIRALSAAYGPSHLVCSFKYGSMGLEEAQANTRLFAQEVLPAAKALQSQPSRAVGTMA